MTKRILALAFSVLIVGCSSDEGPVQPQPDPTVTLNLSVSVSQASSLGYEISRVEAELILSALPNNNGTPPNKESHTFELPISSGIAAKAITGLAEGNYNVNVRVLVDEATLVMTSTIADLTLPTPTDVEITTIDWNALFPEAPQNILFVGNSLTAYNDGLGNLMATFIQAADSNLTTASAQQAFGGFTMQMHWEDEELRARNAIATGQYDWVILQGSPSNMINDPQSYQEFAPLMVDEVTAASAQTGLFVPPSYRDFPQYVRPLSDICDALASNKPVVQVPISQAWDRVIANHTMIDLYHSDGSHPSVWGTYLDLCVVYATLYRRNPQGVEWVNADVISDYDRDRLQRVAWLAASEFFGWL